MASRLDVICLSLAAFASMAAMRLCDAMLPAIGDSFGTTAIAASGAVSAFALAYGPVQILYGPLGDRYGKPRIIGLAALACGAGALAAAAAGSLSALVWSRAAMGAAAGGIIPLTMAWLADHSAPHERQLVLARLLSYTVIGIMAGAWVGGLLADTAGWRWALVAMAAIFMAVGSTVLLRMGRSGHAAGNPMPVLQRFRTILGQRWARQLFAYTFAEGALVFGALAFLPTLLHERFGLPLAHAGAVLALFGVGGLAYSSTARWLLRRLQAAQLAMAGGLVLLLAYLLMALLPHWHWAMLGALLAGFGFYLLHNTLQTCAANLSASARGTALSLFACVLFLGQSAGVTVAAWMAAAGRLDWCYLLAAPALALLATLFAWQLRAQQAGAQQAR